MARRFNKVAVLMGGTSHEREISLDSGANILKGLQEAGYDATGVVLEKDGLPDLPAGTEACYIALHGGWGEDGGVQAALNAIAMPYTGPGAKASRTAMDKIETKRVLAAAGMDQGLWAAVDLGSRTCPIPLPAVVKPPCDGSSIGISLVRNQDEWPAALKTALETDANGRALVEEYIDGREWTVGIIGRKTLPVVEIVTPRGWYGYEEKYLSSVTRYIFPEDSLGGLSGERRDWLEKALKKASSAALKAFDAVGCRGVSRVDFRISASGEPRILEINTAPGFTSHSLVPKAAAKSGLSFAETCAAIIETADIDPLEA